MTIWAAFEKWYTHRYDHADYYNGRNCDPLSSKDNAERAFRAGVRFARNQAQADRELLSDTRRT